VRSVFFANHVQRSWVIRVIVSMRCCVEHVAAVDVNQRELSAAERGSEAQLSAGGWRQAGHDDSDPHVKHRRCLESLARTHHHVLRRNHRPSHLRLSTTVQTGEATCSDVTAALWRSFVCKLLSFWLYRELLLTKHQIINFDINHHYAITSLLACWHTLYVSCTRCC